MKLSFSDRLGGGLRRFAQLARHSRALHQFTFLWDVLRKPYALALRALGPRGTPIVIGGETLRLDPAFATLSWDTIEVEGYRALKEVLRPGAIVYDVGAHIGTYSMLAARWGGANCKIVAFEPCDTTRKYLTRHLDWNDCTDQVLLRTACCGASAGSVLFYFDRDSPAGTNSTFPAEGRDSVRVPMVTLSQEVDSLGLIPDLVKIDVEGAEMDVLRGAEEVLRRSRPALLLSLHPGPLRDQGLSADGVIEWLRGIGYAHRILATDHEIHVLCQAAPQSAR